MAACREGEPAAMRSFVLRYQGPVFAYISRTLGAGPHVEDLAQEVFLRAFRSLSRFDERGSARISTWLLTIASRLVIDERRRRRVPMQPLDADVPLPSADTPETERRRLEIGRSIAGAVGQLSDDQRDVFVLAEFHGLDMKQIGQVLSVPEATVKTRLFRARARLRELLEGILENL
jgi:RNA polymerase sigma-70 factor, ECF subfamily